jgi:hypothetical protein
MPKFPNLYLENLENALPANGAHGEHDSFLSCEDTMRNRRATLEQPLPPVRLKPGDPRLRD